MITLLAAFIGFTYALNYAPPVAAGPPHECLNGSLSTGLQLWNCEGNAWVLNRKAMEQIADRESRRDFLWAAMGRRALTQKELDDAKSLEYEGCLNVPMDGRSFNARQQQEECVATQIRQINFQMAEINKTIRAHAP